MNRFASATFFTALLASSGCSSSDTTNTATDAGAQVTTQADGATAAANDSGTVAHGSGSLSCNDPDDDLCTTYATGDSADCGGSVGNVVASCSTTNVLATCKYNSGGTDQEIFWYMGAGNTTSLMMACNSLGGTFTAGS